MRSLQEQWKGLNTLCGYLELAGLPHGEIASRRGEPFMVHLPVSGGREVVYCMDGYDIWKKHLIVTDLTAEAVVDHLRGSSKHEES